ETSVLSGPCTLPAGPDKLGSPPVRAGMHREISHTDSAFEQESNLSLYLMTALLAALMALDLVPAFATWAGWTPPWPREILGDRVVVKPGAKVPVDGAVVEGRSAVDTSALTGESVPRDKAPGDEVLAGSVNQCGALTIEAKRVAQQTVAGQVIELTARALKD